MHIDCFSSGDKVTRKTRYEDLKAVILEAGRFSTFEASDGHAAVSMFDRLCRDPEVETFNLGYPWTGVRRREIAARMDAAQGAGAETSDSALAPEVR